MKTYNEIATKQDKAFHMKARTMLGTVRYHELIEVAKKEFADAWNNSNEIQRENNARRAANLVFSSEINKLTK